MATQDDRFFEEIYRDYKDKVQAYIWKRVGDAHIAEDLTSDVFFKCYKNIDRYDPGKAAVSTWVFTIVNNTLKNYYRDRKSTASIDNMEGFEPSYEDDMDQAMRLEEIRQYLDEALQQLDETRRKILLMRYYDEMKTKDIADALGMTAGNVRVILTRTLKKLNIDARDNELLRVL
ncbi:MAG: sigma-70 family RNA polymerase sigma factor [Firmicutes bacterium]|nr:sigma-70 family RNA polymerase sigma factor [Bacillota bacterium]